MYFVQEMIRSSNSANRRSPGQPRPTWLQGAWRRFKRWLFEPITTQEWYITESPRKTYNERGATKHAPEDEENKS
jgi:hypothetical protein